MADVGPHGQEDGLEYEAAPPWPEVVSTGFRDTVDRAEAVPAPRCDCPPCRALAAPATGDE